MLQKKSLALAIAASSVALSSQLIAAPSWDYLDLSISDGKIEPDGTDSADYTGYTFDGATTFGGDMFFLRGTSNRTSSDGADVGAPGNDIVIADWSSVGPGAHFTTDMGGMDLDLWGQLTLNQGVLVGSAVDGFGAAVGARLNVSPQFETALSYSFSSMDSEFAGTDTTFDPNLLTLEGLYYITPANAIRLGYTMGDADIEGSALGFPEDSVDLTEIQLGFRHVFGANGSAESKTDAAPLSFNFVQFGYIFAGSSTVDSGGGGVSYDFDNNNGLDFRGAFEIGDIAYFGGQFAHVNANDGDGGLGPTEDDTSIVDTAFFGPGAHFGVSDNVELFGQLGWSSMHYIYVPLEGYGIQLGARTRLNNLEVAAWYQTDKVDGELSGEELEYDGGRFGVDLALEISPGAPEIVLNYVSGDYDLDAPSVSGASVEFDQTSIGVRQRF